MSTASDGVEQAPPTTGPGGSPRTAARGVRLSGVVTAWKSLYTREWRYGLWRALRAIRRTYVKPRAQ